jgi:hypothetical protein
VNEYKIKYGLGETKAHMIIHAKNEEDAREDFRRITTHPDNPQYRGPEIIKITRES